MNTGLATSRRFVLVLGLLTGLVAFAVDISLPAIPDMVDALNTNMSLGQQVIGCFVAGMAFGQLPAGLVSDRIGRMPVLYLGASVFTLAGIVTAVSNDITIILVARFAQGLGASSGMVLARAIVRDISSGREAARILSLMLMIFTAAPMVAPLIGAYLVTHWGWQFPFAATAFAGMLILIGIKSALRETHKPSRDSGIWVQLQRSLKIFVSHPKCIFGLLIALTTMIGIMSLISGASALVIQIYAFSELHFGYLFALTGTAILLGSAINRRLLRRYTTVQTVGVGATLAAVAGIQLLIAAWLGAADFWWLWLNVSLFMCATGFLIASATALALDPVPEIAGVAASVVGTAQGLTGATSAIINSALYTGTILNVTIGVGASGVTVFLIYLLRHRILGERSLAA